MLYQLNLGVTGVVEYLESLRTLRAEGKEALAKCDNVSVDSQATDDQSIRALEEVDPNYTEILKDFATEVDVLVGMEPLICLALSDPLPSGHVKDKPADQTLESGFTPQKIFADLIALRYPKAPLTLVQRLGIAGWERFQRCSQLRSKQSGLADTRPSTAPLERPETTVGKGSTVGDSGYGTEQRTTSYAETVMSYSRNDDFKVRIPRLPREELFECVACGRNVTILEEKWWKQVPLLQL